MANDPTCSSIPVHLTHSPFFWHSMVYFSKIKLEVFFIVAFLIIIFGLAIYMGSIGLFCVLSIVCMFALLKKSTGLRKILLLIGALVIGVLLGLLVGSYFMLKLFGEYLSFINLIWTNKWFIKCKRLYYNFTHWFLLFLHSSIESKVT